MARPDHPAFRPIRHWRIWLVSFVGAWLAIKGARHVSIATGSQPLTYMWIAVVCVLQYVGYRWANARADAQKIDR